MPRRVTMSLSLSRTMIKISKADSPLSVLSFVATQRFWNNSHDWESVVLLLARLLFPRVFARCGKVTEVLR